VLRTWAGGGAGVFLLALAASRPPSETHVELNPNVTEVLRGKFMTSLAGLYEPA